MNIVNDSSRACVCVCVFHVCVCAFLSERAGSNEALDLGLERFRAFHLFFFLNFL